MNAVKIDKEAKTITAQGGCKAEDLEVPLENEGLCVVMCHANDTGKLWTFDLLKLVPIDMETIRRACDSYEELMQKYGTVTTPSLSLIEL